ncbi:CPBP family intramembrane metalloprotease [Fructobacillus sp. M2-14]|uniref:CPBP family intramembrane metalloprotease n=1 Tax=Fructobacillus broussonetiae TaxID=2713173 RepID=A0ABS5R157_9LACO|nr:CPBP family intramembrane glutamic endopeptidase [Fructobacillus broussonetiae]MBS9339171.1 CPBP family intramembrane metalloprotease [Fructobacillus broussonetiae]
MDQKLSFKKLLTLTAVFVVADLICEQILVFNAVNWAFYQFHLTQFEASFIAKMVALVFVLILNALITKQKIFVKPHFSWQETIYWVFIVLLTIPFTGAANIQNASLTGLMGGTEEFFARGVILGIFLTYLLQKGYSRKAMIQGMVYSNIIFGLMHMTNITHVPVSAALAQSVVAMFGGLAYTVLYIQTGSIWAAFAMHAFEDLMLTVIDHLNEVNETIPQLMNVANALFGYFKIILVIFVLFYWKKHEPALSRKIRGAK